MGLNANNVQVTMDSIEALLVSSEITQGDAIAACAGVIWEDKSIFTPAKVQAAMEILRMHRSRETGVENSHIACAILF